MLDELLGRAELKARIEELEEEKRHLERRAAAEEERRSEAARNRQEAEAEVNQLEDKIEGLEERVERLSDTSDAEVDFRGTEALRGARRDEILSRLSSIETDAEGALTAMVHDEVPDSVSETLGERAALVHRAAPCLVCVDDAGLVSVALDPPTPPAAFAEWGPDFRIERSWFAPADPVWVALVRSDLFALGVYDGESVSLVDDVESDVMGAHSKGGFSQARFQRRRDQQVDEHLDRAREAIEAHLEADRDLIVLGEKTVLGRFTDVADRTAAVDATGDPDEALERAVREFWTTRLSLL
ncbi:Vms1/Ankzf1 family peptidyl-tRNA hydrolase [Halobellus captivus]|uniref:Vms1/Ankzf1 family peptidyl-tRNA hydrolase n=1 Tax=Halobellus captivus TaxID=2592614 RepID=UPI0011A66ED5|nr:Vms1/Ankzf1 family peptidyl-tRNA hydrolase [Halobellus captivus]